MAGGGVGRSHVPQFGLLCPASIEDIGTAGMKLAAPAAARPGSAGCAAAGHRKIRAATALRHHGLGGHGRGFPGSCNRSRRARRQVRNCAKAPRSLARGKSWIEAGKRIVEDDLHPAPERSQSPIGQVVETLAIEQDLARGNVEKAQHRLANRRLSAAGLAHQRERLTTGDLDAQIIHRADNFAPGRKSFPAAGSASSGWRPANGPAHAAIFSLSA